MTAIHSPLNKKMFFLICDISLDNLKLKGICVNVLTRFSAAIVSMFAMCTVLADTEPGTLVGNWSFTEDNCTDSYMYKSDGTFSSTSGQEALEGTYRIEVVPSSNPAVFKVVRNIAKDNLGKDCAGSSKDNSGKSDTRYIKFNPSGSEMMVCSSAAANRCFGPLLRGAN